MRSLLIIAHGSRRTASNDEVRALAAALQGRVSDRYEEVRPAFLELAEPSIPAAIDAAVEAGAKEVVVLPYFLAAGSHVASDVPALVEQRRSAHPDVTIELLPHLGASAELPALLAALV